MFTHNAELLAGSQVIHVPESAQPGHSIGLPLLTLSPDNVISVVSTHTAVGPSHE